MNRDENKEYTVNQTVNLLARLLTFIMRRRSRKKDGKSNFLYRQSRLTVKQDIVTIKKQYLKTTNLFKAVAFVAMVIVSIMNSEVKAQDRFITNEEYRMT